MVINYKAIIFNMDGVLIDIAAFYQKGRALFLSKYGLSFADIDMSQMIGSTFKDLWPKLFKERPYTNVIEEDYQKCKKEHPVPYGELLNPQVESILVKLTEQKLQIGLASSSSSDEIKRMLGSCGLTAYFDEIVSGQDFRRTKPDPEIYQFIASKMGYQPAECVAIEDSQFWITAGQEAGLSVWTLVDKKIRDRSRKSG